jgi:pyruvate dehydrogenase E1 component beta subunit/2-oxoisovalerate dehydrogenase E1 component beta subunit
MTRSSTVNTNTFTTTSKPDALPTEKLPIGKARMLGQARSHDCEQQCNGARSTRSCTAVQLQRYRNRSSRSTIGQTLDTDTVLASVARTGRLLCVGEAFPWGGVTAEVIARVATEGFHSLMPRRHALTRKTRQFRITQSLERASAQREDNRSQGAPSSR